LDGLGVLTLIYVVTSRPTSALDLRDAGPRQLDLLLDRL
jgi:hypothetical protein